MTKAEQILFNLFSEPLHVIDPAIPLDRYTELDLSAGTTKLSGYDITDPLECQAYVDETLNKSDALAAYGGYLEHRELYDSPNFNRESGPIRNIHLGMDFWAPANTKVVVPWKGKVHSFMDNMVEGDYGPTIILEHSTPELTFYSLYGHLSRGSLEGLHTGREFEKGETLAWLGAAEVNGNYTPHLHFQLILDMGDFQGDYPGVCSQSTLKYYSKNCPNPNLLLKIG